MNILRDSWLGETKGMATLMTIMAAVSATSTPMLEADQDKIIAYVRAGSNFSVGTYNDNGVYGPSEPVVTESGLDTFFALQMDAISQETQGQIADALIPISSNMTSNTAATASIQQQLSTLMQSFANRDPGQIIDGLEQRLTRLEQALLPVNQTTQCPDYPAVINPATGVIHGSGNVPGSVRVIHCNPGFVLTGPASGGGGGAIVCNASGIWSDDTQSRCVPATSAPTPSPTTPVEMVQCCLRMDNAIFGVYADGRRVRLDTIRVQHDDGEIRNLRSITFPSTVNVLGVTGYDAERGCQTGMFDIICGTSSREGKWNLAGDERWQVRTVKQNPQPNFGSSYATTGYDTQTNGFVNATTRGNSFWWDNSNNNNVCPLANNPATPFWHPLCGGGNGEGPTYWWFRIEP